MPDTPQMNPVQEPVLARQLIAVVLKTAMEGKGRGVKRVPLSWAGLPRRSQETFAWSCLVVECGDDDRDNQLGQFVTKRISPGPRYESTDQKAGRPARLRRDPPILMTATAAADGRHQPRPASKDVGLLVHRHEVTAATGVVSRDVMRNTYAWTGAWTGCRGTPSTASAACAITGGISAAHAPVAPGCAYGKEKVGAMAFSVGARSSSFRHSSTTPTSSHNSRQEGSRG
jgi:hypothetical protein